MLLHVVQFCKMIKVCMLRSCNFETFHSKSLARVTPIYLPKKPTWTCIMGYISYSSTKMYGWTAWEISLNLMSNHHSSTKFNLCDGLILSKVGP